MNKERYYVRWKLHRAISDLNYALECFGDHLAESNNYPNDIDGFDAIYLYLCNKHSWTIEQLRQMKLDDIRLALSEEMKGWKLPPDARFGRLDKDDLEVVIERY